MIRFWIHHMINQAKNVDSVCDPGPEPRPVYMKCPLTFSAILTSTSPEVFRITRCSFCWMGHFAPDAPKGRQVIPYQWHSGDPQCSPSWTQQPLITVLFVVSIINKDILSGHKDLSYHKVVDWWNFCFPPPRKTPKNFISEGKTFKLWFPWRSYYSYRRGLGCCHSLGLWWQVKCIVYLPGVICIPNMAAFISSN